MKQQPIKSNNVNLDILNWLLTKEGNINAEINFKRVVKILAQYRDEFKIIDNIRVSDKIMELHNANLVELNTIKDYVRHQNGLLEIEREELSDVSDKLRSIEKQLNEWIEATTNQVQLMPQMKIEKHKIDLHDGYFYTAELVGLKGMIVQVETKEQAIEELMISIKAKILYDYGA